LTWQTLPFKNGGLMFLSKPRILCVDDEPSILKIFESLLAPHDYEIIKAKMAKKLWRNLTKREWTSC